MTIAAVILTYNEALNLPRCLKSVCWADELLIVDSGSQDRTLEIAQQNAIQVLQRVTEPFIISEQRNYALDNGRLTADWVLFIDADEVITEKLRQEITRTLAQNKGEVVAYRLMARFMFLGRGLIHCQGSPWHDRLVRRGQVRFTGGVWEQFETKGQIGQITEPYLHYSVSKGIGDWFIRHELYATVEALDIAQTLGIQQAKELPFLRTPRKRHLRNWAARFWPLRPLFRFIVMYFGRLGFLDGLPGLLYSLMIFCYEFMVVLKVIELKSRVTDQST